MGINRTPKTGQNPFATQPRGGTGRPNSSENSTHVDEQPIKKYRVRPKSGGTVPINAITSAEDICIGASPSTEKKSGRSIASIGFSFDAQDILTGEKFVNLAKKSYEKGRPYCFGVAIASIDPSSNKKKAFIDGAECINWIDIETFKMPYKITLESGKTTTLHDVQFFAIRENESIERLGSIDEAVRGPNSMILQRFIAQEDNKFYKSVGHVTDIFIACAYSLGVGVGVDRNYASMIMPKLGDEEKEEATPEAFAFATMPEKDTRLAEFLLRHNFDPEFKDPDDETTGIELARFNKNQEVLRLFERYGHRTDGQA